MLFAKIKGDTLLQYPYTMDDLVKENPFTNYGNDQDVEKLYPLTQDAEGGNMLAQVIVSPMPEYSPSTHSCIISPLPIERDGRWELDWVVSPLSAEQLVARVAAQQMGNRAEAVRRLGQTDWTEFPSVVDPTASPHLLNTADFRKYRMELRAIAVSPPETPVTIWPDLPQEQWSNG